MTMSKSVKRILYDAQRKVQKGWAQDAMAKNKDGDMASSQSAAVSWCLVGALQVAANGDWQTCNKAKTCVRKAICRKQRKSKQNHLFTSIISWNDRKHRTKQQVLDVLELAKDYA
jgi:hypothetical protein